MKRGNRHVWIGLGFVAASIIVAAIMFFGLKVATISEEREVSDGEAEAVGELPPAPMSEEDAVTVTNSNEEEPILPAKSWLLGSWRSPMPGDRPDRVSGCETDSIITFNADGSFRDGGSYGRYTLDGNLLTYSEIVLFDQAAAEGEQEDFSRFDTPTDVRIDRIGPNVMAEDSETLHRCSS